MVFTPVLEKEGLVIVQGCMMIRQLSAQEYVISLALETKHVCSHPDSLMGHWYRSESREHELAEGVRLFSGETVRGGS